MLIYDDTICTWILDVFTHNSPWKTKNMENDNFVHNLFFNCSKVWLETLVMRLLPKKPFENIFVNVVVFFINLVTLSRGELHFTYFPWLCKETIWKY